MSNKDTWKMLAVEIAMLVLIITLQWTVAEQGNRELSRKEDYQIETERASFGKFLVLTVHRIITENWEVLSIGFLLTSVFVRIAYCERRYIAVGSEWFVFPIIILVKFLIRDFIKKVSQWL